MVKKVISLAGMLLLFLFYSYKSSGQCWRVYYCDGCVRNGLCPQYQDYNTREEAETSAKLACPAATPDVRQVGCGSPPSPSPGWSKSPVRNGFAGALLGGLVGTLGKDPNGKLLWDLGATGGFATLSIITTIAVPKSRAMGPSITLGILNGSTLCYAAAKTWIQISNKPEAPKPPEEINKITLIAAGAGVVLGGTIGAITARPGKANRITRIIRRSGFFSNTAFTFSGNRLGIVIRL